MLTLNLEATLQQSKKYRPWAEWFSRLDAEDQRNVRLVCDALTKVQEDSGSHFAVAAVGSSHDGSDSISEQGDIDLVLVTVNPGTPDRRVLAVERLTSFIKKELNVPVECDGMTISWDRGEYYGVATWLFSFDCGHPVQLILYVPSYRQLVAQKADLDGFLKEEERTHFDGSSYSMHGKKRYSVALLPLD